ncbi:MAG: VPLPA-CTERM sorting domain-containing protein [Pseudomonadota bacterium]
MLFAQHMFRVSCFFLIAFTHSVGSNAASLVPGDTVGFYQVNSVNTTGSPTASVIGSFPAKADAVTVIDNDPNVLDLSTDPPVLPQDAADVWPNINSQVQADVNASSVTFFTVGMPGTAFAPQSFVVLAGLDFINDGILTGVTVRNGAGSGSFSTITDANFTVGFDVVGDEIISGQPFGEPRVDETDPLLAGNYLVFDASGLQTGSSGSVIVDFQVTPVPLPAGAWLMLSALTGGFLLRRRRKS